MSFQNINLEKIVKEGAMSKVAEFMKKQTANYKSKAATIKKSTYSSFDNSSVSFFEFTPKTGQPLYPAMIYYHGGGFMFPIQKAMMNNSSLYAKNTGVKVFLPEYRLSLDSPCNTTLEDCYSMLKFVFEHAKELNVDPERVFLYGDSAGGLSCRRCCPAKP